MENPSIQVCTKCPQLMAGIRETVKEQLRLKSSGNDREEVELWSWWSGEEEATAGWHDPKRCTLSTKEWKKNPETLPAYILYSPCSTWVNFFPQCISDHVILLLRTLPWLPTSLWVTPTSSPGPSLSYLPPSPLWLHFLPLCYFPILLQPH